jgi:hypothetical protein
MTSRELTFNDKALDTWGELKQAKRVGDGRAALAHPTSKLLMSKTEVLDELLIRGGLLKGIEVLAVQILDQSLLNAQDVADGSHQGRNRLQTGSPGGSPPAFTCDQLVAVVSQGTDKNRLEDTQLADGRSERSHWLLVELRPRLVWVRSDVGNRDLE